MILAFPMRRLSAISLVLLLLLPIFMPLTALGQDKDANPPVCCRRHGGMRHQCAMMTAYLASRLPGTKLMATPVPALIARARCLPGASPTRTDFLPAHFAEVSAHPAIRAHSSSSPHRSRSRLAQARPSSLSSFLATSLSQSFAFVRATPASLPSCKSACERMSCIGFEVPLFLTREPRHRSPVHLCPGLCERR